MKRFIYLVFSVMLLLAAFMPVMAQDNVLVDGLLNPRNISFDGEGNLYVAESGGAGSELTPDETAFGATSQISMISPDGEKSVVVHGLISYRAGNTLGASAVQATEDSLWVLLGESGDFTIPWTHALVEFDKETGRVKNFIDLLTLELEEDPDGNANSQSNPTDFAVAADGSVLIANAGCNCLMSWSADAGLSAAVVWSFADDNPVPTSVEIGPDGDIYVGFLTGFPFPQGGSRIERWSGGELAETYEGLTAVTGLEVTADGRIFAVELGVFEQGWQPGRVVEVTSDGITEVVGNLTAPYGIESTPDGMLAVTTGTFGGPDGAVILIEMP